jgi:hypothetical protein
MRSLLVQYTLQAGTQDEWRKTIADFIANVNNEPELAGRFIYQVMEGKDDPTQKTHLISFIDDRAGDDIEAKPFLDGFRKAISHFASGKQKVTPLTIIARSR